MSDRYISREWLLKELGKYKNLKTWNTEVCDPDTILRVLQVIENRVNGAPDIGPRQYWNKKLEVKNAELKFQLEHLKRQRQHDDENFVMAESVNNKGFAEALHIAKYIASTVDAVPVVRCKACANFRQNASGVFWCDEYGGAITPNDYCSRAVSDKQPRASIPWEAD